MAAIGDKRIGKNMMRVFLAIASHANAQGTCWPSQGRIAAMTGLTRPKVNEAFHKLRLVGYIAYAGRHRSGAWHLQITAPEGVPELGTGGVPETGTGTCPQNGDRGGVPELGNLPVPETGTQTLPRTINPPDTPIGEEQDCRAAADGDGNLIEDEKGDAGGVEDAWRDVGEKFLSTVSPTIRPVFAERIASLPDPGIFWRYAESEAERVGLGARTGMTAAIQKFEIANSERWRQIKDEPRGRKRRTRHAQS